MSSYLVTVSKSKVKVDDDFSPEVLQLQPVNNHEVINNCHRTEINLDGQAFSWIMKHMKRSRDFRSQFLKRYSNNPSKLTFHVHLQPPASPIIDLMGNQLVNSYVLVKCEMDTAFSWLSTLGGAFSALGDISTTWAEEAGRVSMTQLKIAMKLDDPLIASRCRLYAGISLLQRGYLKTSRQVVKNEYKYAMSLPESQDPKLRRMCLGVWAKLQYAWKLNKIKRKQSQGSRKDSSNSNQKLNANKSISSTRDLSNGLTDHGKHDDDFIFVPNGNGDGHVDCDQGFMKFEITKSPTSFPL